MDALSLISIIVTVVLGSVSIWQASKAARSAQAAEERSQQSLDATREHLANSDTNTRKQIEAMERMVRELLDDKDNPSFAGPVINDKAEFTGGNVKLGRSATVIAVGTASSIDTLVTSAERNVEANTFDESKVPSEGT